MLQMIQKETSHLMKSLIHRQTLQMTARLQLVVRISTSSTIQLVNQTTMFQDVQLIQENTQSLLLLRLLQMAILKSMYTVMSQMLRRAVLQNSRIRQLHSLIREMEQTLSSRMFIQQQENSTFQLQRYLREETGTVLHLSLI